jgi:hypothetical protein
MAMMQLQVLPSPNRDTATTIVAVDWITRSWDGDGTIGCSRTWDGSRVLVVVAAGGYQGRGTPG